MLIIRDIEKAALLARPAVLAIGNFDGLHLGHLKVLSTAQKIAERENLAFAVLSFEPHPRAFFLRQGNLVHNKNDHTIRIQSFYDKACSLKKIGAEIFFALRFNQSLSRMSAETFIQDILIRALHAGHIVTGDDFAFGFKRQGAPEMLQKYASVGTFGYTSVSAERQALTGAKYSSTDLRQYIRQGNMDGIRLMLGRPYSLTGKVLTGRKQGRTIGFPTANINLPRSIILPPNGVYACYAYVSGQKFQAVANLGMKPTVDGRNHSLEAHLLNFAQKSLYGMRLELEFLEYIRSERKFDDLPQLAKQISLDIEGAKAAFAQQE